MAERFKAAVLKTVEDESLPRVRIPVSPLWIGVSSKQWRGTCAAPDFVSLHRDKLQGFPLSMLYFYIILLMNLYLLIK